MKESTKKLINEQIKKVLAEVKRAGNILLFVDELHTIIGAGGAEGSLDAANILKPSMARGELQVIGATTIEEYRKATDFTKLEEYGKLLGVDIYSLGYSFEYKLKKYKRSEILSQIEVHLPMELAPILGKIRKLDYKIAYIKNNKIKAEENE